MSVVCIYTYVGVCVYICTIVSVASIYLYHSISICLSVYLSVYLSIYLCALYKLLICYSSCVLFSQIIPTHLDHIWIGWIKSPTIPNIAASQTSQSHKLFLRRFPQAMPILPDTSCVKLRDSTDIIGCQKNGSHIPTIWLWLTVCHGKIHHAIKNGVYHLFRLGPSKNHGDFFCHNQMVVVGWSPSPAPQRWISRLSRSPDSYLTKSTDQKLQM